jgi:CP family cyanate transporter-like MFS transporter
MSFPRSRVNYTSIALEIIVKNKAPAPEDMHVTTTWRTVIICALITLVGFNLRSVILAVPPVLPLIKHDLALSYSATGLLTALPILVLGAGAWPSGLLVERFGGRYCVAIGLVLLGVGGLLRAFWPTAFTLFFFTLLLSMGITLSQTSIPVLARRWFPARIGLVAALFSDGLIIGEAVAAGITLPIMIQFLGQDAWAATFVLWSVPVIVLLVLWLWIAPSTPGRSSFIEGVAKPLTSQNSLSRRQPRVSALHLGIMLGCASLIYFGMNGWIATYNQAIHYTGLTPLALAVLNAAQLPVSLGVTFFAQRLAGRRSPFVVAGAICAVAIAGWVFTSAVLEPFWAALLGGSSALVFTLGVALPPLLASPERVARLTGSTLSLTYGVAFVGPLLGGELWDLFHLPPLAFLPVAIASALLIILGALLPPRTAFGLLAEVGHTGVNKQQDSTPTMPSS